MDLSEETSHFLTNIRLLMFVFASNNYDLFHEISLAQNVHDFDQDLPNFARSTHGNITVRNFERIRQLWN